MAKLHNILALAATALAFTIGVPHSVQAQPSGFIESRTTWGPVYGTVWVRGRETKETKRVREWQDRYTSGGPFLPEGDYGGLSTVARDWMRPTMRAAVAEESRRARLAARQRELERWQAQTWLDKLWHTRFVNGVPAKPFICPGAVEGQTLAAWDPDLTVLMALMAACTSGNGFGGSPSPAASGGTTPSDLRLKRDIDLLERHDNGLGLYRYRYLWSDQLYVGVMAQEVATVAPAAVLIGADGYLRVDYGRLGLRLQTWDEWRAAH